VEALTPLDTAELFAPLHAELMALLWSLAPEDWEKPTLAPAWRVRDVAAHLLDTQMRKLSTQRDSHFVAPEKPIAGYQDLVRFLNELNASWVGVARRFSARVLVELLAVTGPAVAELVASQDPHAPALFPVSWAGERESETWFDTGREYTEWWHHQMQIRDAVGAPLLLTKRWLLPLLEISVRALPRAYESVPAREGTVVVLEVTGEGGGTWSLVHDDEVWRVLRGAPPHPAAVVRADPDSSWRLLYNALSPAAAKERVTIEGDASLAEPLLGARSVMV
jgi:uncharacterized protein (TIGR03083 family)